MTETLHPYEPDTVSAPGETVAELLVERGMTATELAALTGNTPAEVDALFAGELPLTPALAQALKDALGVPASYWLTHERHYRAYLERSASDGG